MTIDLARQISEALVDAALSAHYSISVYDGGAMAIKNSVDRAAILAAMFSTSDDVLTFRDTAGRIVGSMWLIYCNGLDVISDYTANAEMERLAEIAENFGP